MYMKILGNFEIDENVPICNIGTYGRYRPVIPGTIIALVTRTSGKDQETKVNVSCESGIYL